MVALRLSGTEAWTVELVGSISPAAARRAAPGFEVIERDGGVEVGLLVFGMRGLKLDGVPGPAFDYSEALWRVGVVLDGTPGWLGHTCDLDRPLIRIFGRRFVRYPVRTAGIDCEQAGSRWQLRVHAGETLGVSLEIGDETPQAVPARPLAVIGGRRTYSIPWREDPAPFRKVATLVDVEDTLSHETLGDRVRWAPTCLVHRGRTHHCGFARRHRD